MEAYPHGNAARALARFGGILYLIVIVGGIFGQTFIRDRVIVPGDAAATADRIRSLESLWRVGMVSEYFMLVCSIVVALILFILLRPVSWDLALLAVLFNLVTVAMEGANELQLTQTLLALGDDGYLHVFRPEQLDALARHSLRIYGHGFSADLIFFGCACLVLGYLIVRCRYIPSVIGVLMFLAGLSYLTSSAALFAAPEVSNRLHPYILLPALVGEASLSIWLLTKGVNVRRWEGRRNELLARAGQGMSRLPSRDAAD